MYSYPLPYLHYLVHFHIDQDYFECHEILEEFWKEKTEQERDSVWVGLIQVAVAFYHHRRGNMKGAEKMLSKAIIILQKRSEELGGLGIEVSDWLQQLNGRLSNIRAGKPFSPLSIPFTDRTITGQYRHFMQTCLPEMTEQPNNQNPFIVHKHARRDRSEIIFDRLEALAHRKDTNQSTQ